MATAILNVTEPPSGPQTSVPPGIRSNIGSIDREYLGWLRPTSRDTPMSEMRRRFEEDGYLFVKNLLPRDNILNVRKEYFTQFAPTGILEPGTSPTEGIFNSSADPLKHGGIGAGELPPTDLQVQTLISSHVAPDYLQILKHHDLRQFVRDLMGWDEEVLLKRTMLRHNAPFALSTGIHYDKLFLRGGGAYFLTAWVPIGDISLNGGGLIYLSSSNGLGRAIEEDFTHRAASFTDEERISAFNAHMSSTGQLSDDAGSFHANEAQGQGKWLASAYEAGDVVFHDPYTIHGSAKNEDPKGAIRLSSDLRFYKVGSDLDARWMKYWVPGDGL